MGNQFNNWKKIARSSGSGYEQTQATGTNAQSTCVAHLRWRPALPLQHYIETFKKTKKSLYVRERGQPQSSAPCRLEPVSQPTPSSKKYPKIEKNFSRYLTLTCKIQKKKKKKKKNFSRNKTQPRKKKKKKKKKKK